MGSAVIHVADRAAAHHFGGHVPKRLTGGGFLLNFMHLLSASPVQDGDMQLPTHRTSAMVLSSPGQALRPHEPLVILPQ